jgi:hypothetical protein
MVKIELLFLKSEGFDGNPMADRFYFCADLNAEQKMALESNRDKNAGLLTLEIPEDE